jgi:hypothetical protein
MTHMIISYGGGGGGCEQKKQFSGVVGVPTGATGNKQDFGIVTPVLQQ